MQQLNEKLTWKRVLIVSTIIGIISAIALYAWLDSLNHSIETEVNTKTVDIIKPLV